MRKISTAWLRKNTLDTIDFLYDEQPIENNTIVIKELATYQIF